MTKAQRAVLEALRDQARFLSAQDIHGRLRQSGSTVGLTSVYRAAQALRDAGAIDEARMANAELGYRLCGTAQHHHHLTCERCGATVEIEAAIVEEWIESVARQHGYVPARHTVEIVGACRSCARA